MRTYLALLYFFSALCLAESRIDLKRTLFGVESTFQDETILKDLNVMDPEMPDYIIWDTPYKLNKTKQWALEYSRLSGLPQSNVKPIPHSEPKHGYYVLDDKGTQIPLVMEPLIIEWAARPLHYDEIVPGLTNIYKSAKNVGLTAYVLPGGVNSGGGEIHVGGKTLQDSPFYQYPNLLRNMLVYVHKHPSLLYGFAEAFELGPDSSTESYHSPEKQKAFIKAIGQFDDYFKENQKEIKNGKMHTKVLGVLINLLRKDKNAQLVNHDRFINIENLIEAFVSNFDDTIDLRKMSDENFKDAKGKYTIEFRLFRSAKTPEEAKARVELLVKLMEHLSKPGLLEPLAEISENKYQQSLTSTVIAADWEKVKSDLGLVNSSLDSQIKEMVELNTQNSVALRNIEKGELLPAFSNGPERGRFWEVKLPFKENSRAPNIKFENKKIPLTKVETTEGAYWVGRFDSGSNTKTASSLVLELKHPSSSCSGLLQRF